MFEYRIGDLAEMLSAVLRASRDFDTADQLKQSIATKENVSNLAQVLNGLYITCQNFDADPSLLGQMLNLRNDLGKANADTRDSILHARLEAIIDGIQNNLNSRKFMYIPSDQADYWNKADMFGYEFLYAFPRHAVLEMREAGNCFAAARWTACVFHCIRVAEYGLRKLASNLKVKITDKGKSIPIEYGDWTKVINAIRNKLESIRKQPVGEKRQNTIIFYSDSVDHCQYIRDIIRNEVSHARRSYTKDEALATINRVRDFIVPIAQRKSGKIWWEKVNAEKRFKESIEHQKGSAEIRKI